MESPDDDANAAARQFPRPVWSRRWREEVSLQKLKMNLPSPDQVKEELQTMHFYTSTRLDEAFLDDDSDIPVVDVHLAVRGLEQQQKRRFYVMDLFLALTLTVVLCVYALNSRIIPNQFYLAQGVLNDVFKRAFIVEHFSFDLNTGLDTKAQLGVFDRENGGVINTMTSLDPNTLQSIDNGALFRNWTYETCGPIAHQGATCLPAQQVRNALQQVRNVAEFDTWMRVIALNESKLFSAQTLRVLGQVRLRQITYRPLPPGCPREKTGEELVAFNLSVDPFWLQGPRTSPLIRASRLDQYYPNSGYVFDFTPQVDNSVNLARWDELVNVRCPTFLSSNNTRALILSLTAYDYVTDALVFAQFLLENYVREGSVLVPEADVRVFRIPGSDSDVSAHAWRITLCALSLAYLFFYLARLVYRATQRYRKKYAEIWWDRWLLLNLLSLALIQAAVWMSMQNAMDRTIRFVGNNLPALNESYVALLDNVSFDERIVDVLLGICLVLECFKLLQLIQNVWPSLAAPYLTLNFIARDLLSWFLLMLCFYFFFALGAAYAFGNWVGAFSSAGWAFQSTFLILSRVPSLFFTDGEMGARNGLVLSSEFWSKFEHPELGQPLVWEVHSFFQTYEVDAITSYAMWFSLVVLIIFWALRNLLLAIVMTGYETVRREMDINALETRLERKVYSADALPAYRRLERFVWKMWHQVKLDHFLAVMTTRQTCAVTTSVQMRAIFDEALLPQWFREEFLERYLFPLRLVDSAILLLVLEERAFALPLSVITSIRNTNISGDKERMVAATFQACREQSALLHNIPFARGLGRTTWDAATQETRDYVFQLATRHCSCPDASGETFDIGRLAFLLMARIDLPRGEAMSAERILAACSEELQLDFSSVVWDELLGFVDHTLQHNGNGREEEEVVWALADVFPVRGFVTSRAPVMEDLTTYFDQAKEEEEEQVNAPAFNPQAQLKWETCMLSGEFALTLSVISALRAKLVSDYLHQELFDLEQRQVELEKEILHVQQVMDSKHAYVSPFAPPAPTPSKHGIEFHAQDSTYRVHFYSKPTYKFVGVFASQEEAEDALARTTREFDESASAPPAPLPSWRTDNADYSSQAGDKTTPLEFDDETEQGLLDVSNLFSQREREEEEEAEAAEAMAAGDVLAGLKLGARTHSRQACTRACGAMQQAWSATIRAMRALLFGRAGKNTLTYDTSDTVWRDARGHVVPDVITKPKSILPLAGNAYMEMQEQQQ